MNAEFVPAWINIRTTPVPDLACMEEVLNGVELDWELRVQGKFSQGFFLRSVVLASDGETLLNRQPGKATVWKLIGYGYFPYAQVKPEDYLKLLRDALERARAAGP